jgi:hypothetical protein
MAMFVLIAPCILLMTSFMQGLAAELRQRLGLQLFNFDLICPEEQPNAPAECLYYVSGTPGRQMGVCQQRRQMVDQAAP